MGELSAQDSSEPDPQLGTPAVGTRWLRQVRRQPRHRGLPDGLVNGEWRNDRVLRPRWNARKAQIAPWAAHLSQNAAKVPDQPRKSTPHCPSCPVRDAPIPDACRPAQRSHRIWAVRPCQAPLRNLVMLGRLLPSTPMHRLA